MKIRLLVSRAGSSFVQNRGDVIDVSEVDGQSMIAAGQAELVRDIAVERAVPARKSEKAVK